MKERLLKFLNSQNLSSARFAEIIGVQPSGISHILSGRNKPGFDFIQKILSSYPSLNAEWLIIGKGNMFKNENVQGDLFSGEYDDNKNDSDENKEMPDEQIEDKDIDNEDINNFEDTDVKKTGLKDDYRSQYGSQFRVTDVTKDKVVKKIVIFYSDRSFTEYLPE